MIFAATTTVPLAAGDLPNTLVYPSKNGNPFFSAEKRHLTKHYLHTNIFRKISSSETNN